MKMVKSLLLGSAAGLVAVAGAQAADLPVKAKPVEYVKICSLYGAGFYYIPGTDTCLKIGGWVRAEVNLMPVVHSPSSERYNLTVSYLGSMQRGDPRGHHGRYPLADRVRHVAFVLDHRDHRDERPDWQGRLSWQSRRWQQPRWFGPGPYTRSVRNAAFIQLAGFTGGQDGVVLRLRPAALFEPDQRLGLEPGRWRHDVFAYTAQFGNGLSASLSA